jgi:hypothetical protein
MVISNKYIHHRLDKHLVHVHIQLVQHKLLIYDIDNLLYGHAIYHKHSKCGHMYK